MDPGTAGLLRLVKLSDNEAIVSTYPHPYPPPGKGGGAGRGEDLMANRRSPGYRRDLAGTPRAKTDSTKSCFPYRPRAARMRFRAGRPLGTVPNQGSATTKGKRLLSPTMVVPHL